MLEDFPTGVLVEDKYDGIRAQAHKSGQKAKLFSRTLDEIAEFPELFAPLAALPGEFILDGEILVWRASSLCHLPTCRSGSGENGPSCGCAKRFP